MNRIVILLGWLAFVSGLEARELAPNVILILADDLGYETIGANGGTSYKTPVLDGLARTGVRFTHAYAQPLCTPTRVQLMTGLSNIRNYTRFAHMDPNARTFAHLAKKAGYATCVTGKWQLGHDVALPKKFGFDESCLWQHTRRPPRYANPGLEYNGVEKNFTKGEYGPDLVNDYALDFITRNKDKPFFLYYPMILTHSPYQATPDSKTWDPKAEGESANIRPEHFGDMVAYMDKLIGKLTAKLEALGLRQNTLILFLGDNGTGKGTVSLTQSGRVVGGKGTTTRAGMHVPLIVSWPARIAQASVCNDLIDTTDFVPTLAEVLGVKPEVAPDGQSFLPQIVGGQKATPKPWIYSWYSPNQGRQSPLREFAFDQKYKLYRNGNFFDLDRDPEEHKPMAIEKLIGEQAEAAKRLQSALDRFNNIRRKGK
jgi:arylsulfatase A